ncbi:TRAP transporter small permease [Aquincola sp. S2]|uniref:TRAP transporter small permease protein n=1 Tax=Pseudaquabacterium terrae TaxID=2732868 RepID=A0ABX2EE90_9BURK|nr:TRAP transporter small permease [Aquabacterium terrae]NRF66945.1 TRAP transporter small permease [Aquabacterium terrae]
MKNAYQQAMERLYLACVVISGVALVVITLIIPVGVFMRYAMHSPLSWPEPASVIMMVMFSFIGGAAVYRAKVHIAVQAFVNAVSEGKRRAMGWLADGCMAATALFMLGYGVQLCMTTRFQTIAEFPWLSVAYVYLPIPIAGLLTLLFLIERIWVGEPPPSSVMYSDQAAEVE